MLARWCVGHAARTRVVVGALTGAVAISRPAPRWVQFYLCSALFNVVYWGGVAEATQLGAALWSRLIEPPAAGCVGVEAPLTAGGRPGTAE
jgi:hypothetical protein